MNGSQSKAKASISTRWVKVKMGVAEWARDIDVLNRRLGETRRRRGAKDDRVEIQREMEACSFWETREGTLEMNSRSVGRGKGRWRGRSVLWGE